MPAKKATKKAAKKVAKASPTEKGAGTKNADQTGRAGQKGKVRWYDVREGHGLIDPASGGDPVVVVYANILPDTKGKLQMLYPGDEVEFESENSDKRVTPLGVNRGPGTLATNVKITVPAPRRTERYPLIH